MTNKTLMAEQSLDKNQCNICQKPGLIFQAKFGKINLIDGKTKKVKHTNQWSQSMILSDLQMTCFIFEITSL